jgi:CRP/FNR family cyclic AMP-dependent transcriptional regulator
VGAGSFLKFRLIKRKKCPARASGQALAILCKNKAFARSNNLYGREIMNTLVEPKSEIQSHPFLRGATHEFIQKLVIFDEQVTFSPGELILRERGYADRFYLLQSGTVELQAGGTPGQPPAEICELGPGDALGWSWLYPPYLWHFSARAKTECKAFVFPAPALLIHAEENPAFGYELMKRLSVQVIQRLQKTRELLLEERLKSAGAALGSSALERCSRETRGVGCRCGHNKE